MLLYLFRLQRSNKIYFVQGNIEMDEEADWLTTLNM